jgi:hypothetical protein
MANYCAPLPNGVEDYKQQSGIKRLPIGKIPAYAESSRKGMHSEETMDELLTGTILIEEKLDGRSEIKHSPDGRYTLFGENLRTRHSVPYYQLPSWFVVFDICDNRDRRWLDRTQKEEVCDEIGCFLPPKIYEGSALSTQEIARRFLEEPVISGFDDTSPIEGVVIKNIDKGLFGKVVRSEFLEGIESMGDYRKEKRSEKEKYNRLRLY